MKKILLLVPAFFILIYTQQAFAQFTLVQDATQLDCNCVELTPSVANRKGAMWSNTTIDLSQSFDYTFSVFLGEANFGADGMAFVFQQAGTSTIGGWGGNMGFGEINNSFGVVLDNFRAPSDNDPVFDHISLHKDGDEVHGTANELTVPVQTHPNIDNVEDSAFHDLRITWDGLANTMEVYFDGFLRVTYADDIVTSIFGGNSIVYWGFVASTGGLYNQQIVCTNSSPEISIVGSDTVCLSTEVTIEANMLSTYNNVGTWQWDLTEGQMATTQTATALYSNSGYDWIYVTTTDAFTGCDGIDSVQIIKTAPTVGVSSTEDTLCYGSQTLLGSVVTPGPVLPCSYSLSLTDTYGDGWNGGYLTIHQNGVATDYAAADEGLVNVPTNEIVNIPVNDGDVLVLDYTSGSSENENYYWLKDYADNTLHADGNFIFGPNAGTGLFTHTVSCPQGSSFNYSWLPTDSVVNSASTSTSTNILTTNTFYLEVTDPETGCVGTDSTTVVVMQVPGPGDDGLVDLCESEDTVALFNYLQGTPGTGGIWVNPAGDTVSDVFNPAIDPEGDYNYILANGGLCPDTMAVVAVSVEDQPSSGVGGNISLCEDAADFSLFNQLTNADFNGVWVDPTNNVTDSVFQVATDAEGVYTYTVSGNLCPDSSSTVGVSINALPQISFTENHVSCFGYSDGSIATNVTSDGSTFTYVWSNGTTIDNIQDIIAGTYSVSVGDNNGCSAISVTDITEPIQLTQTTTNSLPTCKATCDATMSVAVTGGVSPYLYTWSNGVLDTTVIEDLCEGQYSVTVVDNNNCILISDTLLLVSLDSLNGAISLSTDSGTIPLTVQFTNESVGIDSNTEYEWEMGSETTLFEENPMYEFTNEGEFDIQFVVTNLVGCSDTIHQSITALEPQVELIPQTFSPNGDGINELFLLRISNLETIEVQIFNRWGVQVAMYDSPLAGWSGVSTTGNELPEGTYFYSANYQLFNDSEVKTLQGSITLVR